MSRVILLTSFILLQFCNYGRTQNPYSTYGFMNLKDDVSDDSDTDDRNNSFEDGVADRDGSDKEKPKIKKLMGIDYLALMDVDDDEPVNDLQVQRLSGLPSTDDDDSHDDIGNRKAEIVMLDPMDTRNYKAEIKAANHADVLGINPHFHQPELYPDFGRRFVFQYPYKETVKNNIYDVTPKSLTPKLVSPELYMAVAKKSALIDAARPKGNSDELVRKDILRNGDFWNAVWKEDVNPQALRTRETKKLIVKKKIDDITPKSLTPKLVSPELFMAVAKKSALIDAARPKGNSDELIRKDILRNGDFWNAVWKEDVNPQALRTRETKKLETIRAEIPPGSKLYNLMSKLKQKSPTLLYVINKDSQK